MKPWYYLIHIVYSDEKLITCEKANHELQETWISSSDRTLFQQTVMKYVDTSVKLLPHRQIGCPVHHEPVNIPVPSRFFGKFDSKCLTAPPPPHFEKSLSLSSTLPYENLLKT